MNLCVDCKHFRKYPQGSDSCMRETGEVEPVYGRPLFVNAPAEAERRDTRTGRCGPGGIFWQSDDEDIPMMLKPQAD